MSRRTIDRTDFLQRLESLKAGLSPREQVHQSSCFAFKDGWAQTFNGEVCCRIKSKLSKSFEGALTAKKLLNILGKLKEDAIEVDPKEGRLVFYGKRKHFWEAFDPEVRQPTSVIEAGGKWKPLAENFCDAVTLVSECTKKESDKWKHTTVHITPKWIEATDNVHLCRYRLKTGFTEEVLVRGESLKHVASLDMTEFSEAASWIHFRNPLGLTLSCRRWTDAYPYDIGSMLTIEGTPVVLPKKLAAAVERAEVYSQENADNDKVVVELLEGKIRIKGEGISGGYVEWSGLKYAGPDISFLMPPKMLCEIVTRYNECHVTESKLSVDGGRWKYCVSLYRREERHYEKKTPKEDD